MGAEKTTFDISAETLRRLSILKVLYHQRRTDEENPRLTHREIELNLGAPRGSLNFALWYLQGKGYVIRADSGSYGISAEGVDHLEEQACQGRVDGFSAEQEAPAEQYSAAGSRAQIQGGILN